MTIHFVSKYKSFNYQILNSDGSVKQKGSIPYKPQQNFDDAAKILGFEPKTRERHQGFNEYSKIGSSERLVVEYGYEDKVEEVLL